MTSDAETTKTKVVDSKKLYNFVVDDIFIWNRLDSQTLILNSVEHNMRRKNIWYRNKCVWGGMVRESNARWWSRGFEPQWPWSLCFSHEKFVRLATARARVATQWGLSGLNKILLLIWPIFENSGKWAAHTNPQPPLQIDLYGRLGNRV